MMKWILVFLCLLGGSLVGPLSAAGLIVTPEQAGGVFLTNEPVTFQIQGAPQWSAAVVAYTGREITQTDGTGASLVLGRMPRGYYVLTVGAGPGEASRTPFVVVSPPLAHAGGRVNVDAAHAWLIAPGRLETGAEMLHRSGVSWVRERMTWAEEEPERGRFTWSERYEQTVNSECRRGLKVDEIFHSTPAWARADGDTSRFPDDLRDAYTFAKAAAAHFSGRVRAWEVWNEADISGFSPELGSEYAAFLKAADLGFKAGDPHVLVAQTSFAVDAASFSEALYRNGTPAYFDIFNWHIYDDPSHYAERAQGHDDRRTSFGALDKPSWLTEAGIVLNAADSTLTDEDKRRQAEFLGKSVTMALATGADRTFFFVFPHYLENGHEFGLMDAEQRPYPAYAALAAATDLLGAAHYLGRVRLADPQVQGRLFDSGRGRTLVLWRDGPPSPTTLPLPAAGRKVFDLMGMPLPAGSDRDHLRLVASASPVYVCFAAGETRLALVPPGHRPVQPSAPAPGLPAVIVRARLPGGDVRKDQNCYVLPAGTPVPLHLETYNFGVRACSGTLHLSPPPGCTVSAAALPVSLPPMGRQVFSVTLSTASVASPQTVELRAWVSQGKDQSSRAVLDFAPDPVTLRPTATYPLALDSGQWQKNLSDGAMQMTPIDSGMRYDVDFSPSGDHWAYPWHRFDSPQDWGRYDALALDIRAGAAPPGVQVRVMVLDQGDSVYMNAQGITPTAEWKRVVLPLRSLEWGGFSPVDPAGHLNLHKIVALRVGANVPQGHLSLEVRNIRLIRLSP